MSEHFHVFKPSEQQRHCEAMKQTKNSHLLHRRGNPVGVKYRYSRRMFGELGCFGRE